jgi:hypothetical protein
MPAESTPYLSIDLGANGGPCVFRDFAEAEAWISAEVNYWQWVGQAASGDEFVNGVWGHIDNSLQRMWNVTQQVKSNNASVGALRSIIGELYPSGRLLHSSTSRAQFVDLLKEREPR